MKNFKCSRYALLNSNQMATADKVAISGGISGGSLMANAGQAVVNEIAARWGPQQTTILCGPGNNGGDGFVIARLLRERGWSVRLGLLGSSAGASVDAQGHAKLWGGPNEEFSVDLLKDATLVVDAIFGAGLSRPIDGRALEVLKAVKGRTCVAVDIPSGVDGDTGAIHGFAPKADLTVTFFRKKPGHLLLPGRNLCGELIVADIGIPDTVLETILPNAAENSPALWLSSMPILDPCDHKFCRGYAVIAGSAEMPGAAILAAAGARRAGAGMVSLAVPREAAAICRLAAQGAVVRVVRDTGTFEAVVEDPRVSAVLVGPGLGVTVSARERVLAAFKHERPVILDADAISVFENNRDLLFSSASRPYVMTPHEGEFKRLFDLDGDKVSRARSAASESGAIIVLKGADTVIAAPDGRAVINCNAPPTLATSGSGDVLAGIVTSLIAQGMEPFEAAAAGVWMHGQAAKEFGLGLIAEDLPEIIPKVLKDLKTEEGQAVGKQA